MTTASSSVRAALQHEGVAARHGGVQREPHAVQVAAYVLHPVAQRLWRHPLRPRPERARLLQDAPRRGDAEVA
jgi:hypothetical protein